MAGTSLKPEPQAVERSRDAREWLTPPAGIGPSLEFRLRMGVRWARFGVRSLFAGNFDFAWAAACTELEWMRLCLRDLFARERRVACNLCGWSGRSFYPNVGPGYNDRNIACPGCGSLDRHRALHLILATETSFFEPSSRIVEVAPFRAFQAYCLAHGGLDYTSFDLERFAMEKGDITDMPYPDASVDYFLCFHVLEHIPDEAKAVSEILRVLKPGGTAILQVPVDWNATTTREFDAPDPRDANHVRQYGADFGDHIASYGFDVRRVAADECVPEDVARRHGLSNEPVFLAVRRT